MEENTTHSCELIVRLGDVELSVRTMPDGTLASQVRTLTRPVPIALGHHLSRRATGFVELQRSCQRSGRITADSDHCETRALNPPPRPGALASERDSRRLSARQQRVADRLSPILVD